MKSSKVHVYFGWLLTTETLPYVWGSNQATRALRHTVICDVIIVETLTTLYT